jgi:hypothetical protein
MKHEILRVAGRVHAVVMPLGGINFKPVMQKKHTGTLLLARPNILSRKDERGVKSCETY